MKILLATFIFLVSIQLLYAFECLVGDKPKADTDCVHCNESLKTPTDSVPKAMGTFSNLLSNKDDQLVVVNKLKTFSQMLNSPKAKSACSNYQKLLADYQMGSLYDRNES